MSCARSRCIRLMALAGFVAGCAATAPMLARAAETNSFADDLVVAQAGSTGGTIGKQDKSLSGDSAPASQPDARLAPAPARRSSGSGESYDGAWTVVARGCGAGTMPFFISRGQITGQGLSGRITSDGSVSSVYHGGGITSLSHGRLSGRGGSGNYKNSDGCSGRWTAVKQ